MNSFQDSVVINFNPLRQLAELGSATAPHPFSRGGKGIVRSEGRCGIGSVGKSDKITTGRGKQGGIGVMQAKNPAV